MPTVRQYAMAAFACSACAKPVARLSVLQHSRLRDFGGFMAWCTHACLFPELARTKSPFGQPSTCSSHGQCFRNGESHTNKHSMQLSRPGILESAEVYTTFLPSDLQGQWQTLTYHASSPLAGALRCVWRHTLFSGLRLYLGRLARWRKLPLG